VQLDEFVDLGARELPAFSHRPFEAIPGVAVSQHERIDVHQRESLGGRRPHRATPGSVRSMSELVAGDAVLLDVRIAQLPVRAVGALIAIVVILIGYLISLFLWAAPLSELDGA